LPIAVGATVPQEAETTAEVGAEKDGPHAEVTKPMKDFGEVPKGKKLQHDYEIKNTGDEDLVIRRVVPACGCTVADYDEVIAPGETGKVRAEIDTNILGGRNRRFISVYTNDPENPVVRLHFDARPIPHLEVHPGYARYQVVHGEEEPGIVRQWIYAIDGKDFQVTGVDSPLSYLDTRFHRATEDERHPEISERLPDSPQWLVEMHLDYNRAPTGAIAQEVVVRTDHELQDEIVIPVSGFVRPPMWATPHEVDLGEIRAGEPVRLSVVVQNFLTEPMEITGVQLDGESVESSVEPILEGRKYTVWVTVTPSEDSAGRLDGTLQIRTSHPKNPVVEVPVRATVL